jgi:hypothetical protein
VNYCLTPKLTGSPSLVSYLNLKKGSVKSSVESNASNRSAWNTSISAQPCMVQACTELVSTVGQEKLYKVKNLI